jgi:hypothetical protein|tara:strand:+ start:582 stop:770 length:189 start_codon:yes stop_codon:yes gene_type:complete
MNFVPPKKINTERKMMAISEPAHKIMTEYALRYETSMTKMLDAILAAHVHAYPLNKKGQKND